jgi:hypothetical protein
MLLILNKIIFWHTYCFKESNFINLQFGETNMKKLTEGLKKMLDALAYAHAGEHLSRREKMQVLPSNNDIIHIEPTPVAEAVAASHIQARKIALYLGSELPQEVMDYVIETCASLEHEMTVLTFETEAKAKSLIEPHLAAIAQAGINYELVTLQGTPVTGLARYLKRHSEVAFMACKEAGYLARTIMHGPKKNVLPVPVVVVTTKKQDGRSNKEENSNISAEESSNIKTA